MLLNYKTGRLLPHLVALGFMLIPLGVWQIVTLNLAGIVLLLIGLLLISFRYGFLIDAFQMQLKLYSGMWGIKKGYWQDISTAEELQIITSSESQGMSVLSINRTSFQKTTKLFLVLPNENIELMSGSKKKLMKAAQEISTVIKVEFVDRTETPNS